MADPKSQFNLESRFNKHTHNGLDSQKVNLSNVIGVPDGFTSAPLSTVSDPSGGATQDAEARTAIIALIDKLESLGLLE